MKTYGNDRAKTFGISSSLIDAVRQVTSGQPIEEETPEELETEKPEQLDEDMSIHVTPHNNGTHHVVRKVGSKMKKHGGVKVGEKLSDTEIDDAKDSGIKVHHENKQYDLPGKPKKLKDTPVEKAKKMHLAATPGQEKAVLEVVEDEDDLSELHSTTISKYHDKSQKELQKIQAKYGNNDMNVDALLSKKDSATAGKRFKGSERAEKQLKKRGIQKSSRGGATYSRKSPANEDNRGPSPALQAAFDAIDKMKSPEANKKRQDKIHKARRDDPGFQKWLKDRGKKNPYSESADLITSASNFINMQEGGMKRIATNKELGIKGDGLEGFKKTPIGPRQMKDPKKDAMVSHPKHGTKVIDKKDEDKHLKKGWVRAEAFDPENINLLDEGFQSAIDVAMRELDSYTFKRRYGHSKAEMRKRLQGISAVSGGKIRREDVSHPAFGKGLYIEDHDDDRVTAMFGDGIKEVDVDEIDEWYIDGESIALPLSEKKKAKKNEIVDTSGLEGEYNTKDDKSVDEGDYGRSKKVKKSMKEWAQDNIIGKMIENPSRSAADAYQLATHYYNMSKGIDEELLDKAATLYGTFLEMDEGENPVFRFEDMDRILEARKGGGAEVGETERSGHRVTQAEKDGPEHITMQLRKVESLKHAHSGVDFNDGTKVKIKSHHAAAALDRYNAAKPAEKEELQKHMAHSHDALKHVADGKPLHSSPAAKKSSGLAKPGSGRLEPTRNLVHPSQDQRPT